MPDRVETLRQLECYMRRAYMHIPCRNMECGANAKHDDDPYCAWGKILRDVAALIKKDEIKPVWHPDASLFECVCGMEIKGSEKFCPECGRKFNWEGFE